MKTETQIESVVIVGTGAAGLTAAIHTARASLNPLVLEGGQPGGQLTTTSEVENFPGFPAGVDGFQLMDNLRQQAKKFGTRFEQTRVRAVDFSSMPRRLICDDRTILARSVIIATGASPRLTGIPGEKELYGGKGVSVCATCDGAFYRKMDVAVIGGGDSACEEALFLTRFATKVYLVHRRDTLRASKIMAERATSHPKIDMIWNSAPQEILGVPEGAVSALRVRNVKTGATRDLPVKGVFVTIGHQPNTAPFTPTLAVDENGYFIPAAGMGCQAAIEAERWLAEHESTGGQYEPEREPELAAQIA